MHIVLILVILIAIAAYFVMNQNTQDEQAMVTESGSIQPATLKRAFAYLSRGKLFFKSPDADAREVHSEYIQQLLDKREKNQRLHGWKQETSFGTSFVGGGTRQDSNDNLSVEFTGLTFIPGGKQTPLFHPRRGLRRPFRARHRER